jgi:hypothetical protein
MDIQKISTSCIILVHHYELPFLKLASGNNLEKLAKAFNFQRAEVSQDSSTGRISSLLLRNGIFQADDGSQIAISGLEVEERKIVINNESNSNYSKEFYDNLVIIIIELADFPKGSLLEPIIMTYESQIIAHMRFPISSLLSGNYLEYVQSSVLTSVATEFADVILSPVIIAFDVDFLVKDEYLSQHRIALARKQFSVQPAIGHPFDEQIYYSNAPVDTQTHLQLLEDLEERMMT